MLYSRQCKNPSCKKYFETTSGTIRYCSQKCVEIIHSQSNRGEYEIKLDDYFIENAIDLVLFRPEKIRCIYYLTLMEKIVYIGQTNNIIRRLGDHIHFGLIEFDNIKYIRYEHNNYIKATEQRLIDKYKPKHNILGTVLQYQTVGNQRFGRNRMHK